MKKIILTILVLAVVGIQFIPVDRSNPPVVDEINWDSPETRAIAQQSCFDCHSNETVWPWYSYVAPFSWRVASHVEHGREHLNFSEWNRPNEDLDEIKEMVEEGRMPLWDYLLLHGDARLTESEKEQLLQGLEATYEIDPNIEHQRNPPAGGSD